MLSRRSFLVSAGGLALLQLMSGCSSDNQASLRVRLLKNSIPPQLPGQFRQQLDAPVALSFTPEAQLKDIFERLQIWHQKERESEADQALSPPLNRKASGIADLVTLGDYWLASAIREKLISPLNIEQLSGWQRLALHWQNLVKRNENGELDHRGKIWGAPYRWGSTMIAYRRDKFEDLGWTPTDWGDLWKEELRDRISLIDQPREVIGLTLKKLGFSFNVADLASIPNLKKELLALHKQVKLYSSNAYLEPLIIGDVWLAVGWSTDILPLLTRYPNVKAVIPYSGTALWADLWVQPAQARETPDSLSVAQQWIDFCWQPKPASQITLFSRGTSPVILNMNPADLPKDLQNNPLLLPNRQILDKSEFLYPLSASIVEQYQSLWLEVRQS